MSASQRSTYSAEQLSQRPCCHCGKQFHCASDCWDLMTPEEAAAKKAEIAAKNNNRSRESKQPAHVTRVHQAVQIELELQRSFATAILEHRKQQSGASSASAAGSSAVDAARRSQ